MDAVILPLPGREAPPPALIVERPARLLIPSRPEEIASHYDLTLSRPTVDLPMFAAFDGWLAGAAAARGLSCALIHDGTVHEAIRRLQSGEMTIGYHLDYYALWHLADDPYARLAQAVQDAGGRPVNPPPRSRFFTDKATAHAELARHGFGVPETLLVRPWTPDRPLTAAERRRLRLDEPGACVFVKPANGFGGRGVIRTDAAGLPAALATARLQYPGDTILLQRGVACPRLVGDDGVERPAYWRVLCCLGELLPFWWSHRELEQGRPAYRELTPAEVRRLGLQAVLDFAAELAELCGLDWFSTEICLGDGAEASRFRVRCPDGQERPVVGIDYVNDQCDMDVQSRWPGAVPDAVVRHVAGRFAEAAARQRPAVVLPFPERTARGSEEDSRRLAGCA